MISAVICMSLSGLWHLRNLPCVFALFWLQAFAFKGQNMKFTWTGCPFAFYSDPRPMLPEYKTFCGLAQTSRGVKWWIKNVWFLWFQQMIIYAYCAVFCKITKFRPSHQCGILGSKSNILTKHHSQAWSFWTFWRFSGWIWAKLASIYSKSDLLQNKMPFFPLASRFMKFLLRHEQKTNFCDKKVTLA